MISVVDTGSGNINSIVNMLNHLGFQNSLTCSTSDFQKSKYIILPGIGSFDSVIKNLKIKNLLNFFKDETNFKDKFLIGICVGMQILVENSEEGIEDGLGLIPGNVIKFDKKKMRVPHVGWNKIHGKNFYPECDNQKYYFAHSYHVNCDEKYIWATFNYASHYPAIIKRKNIIGIQFHPEKSHKNGMLLFQKLFSH